MKKVAAICVLAINIAGTSASAETGKIKGSALVHTPHSVQGVMQQAAVTRPAIINEGKVFQGKWMDLPRITSGERYLWLSFWGHRGGSVGGIYSLTYRKAASLQGFEHVDACAKSDEIFGWRLQ